jgi:predicted transposase/invertase (TIGR01784 family)
VPFAQNKIQDVTFLKTSQDPEIASQKQSIVDVLCVDEKGQQYIVEMQVAKTEHFVKRDQYYAAKAYCSQMHRGQPYEKLKEIIFLAIVDFTLFPEKSYYKSDHVILDRDTHEHDLKDFSFSFIELPKFHKTKEELTTIVDKWAYFFKHAEETSERDMSAIVGSDEVIAEAYEALNQYFWTDDELFFYDRELREERDAKAILDCSKREGREEGREEGITIGIEKGKKLALAPAVQYLLTQNKTHAEIAAILGLAPEDLMDIYSEMNVAQSIDVLELN